MRSRTTIPVVLIVLGILLVPISDHVTRLSRTGMAASESGTPWVRYVMVGMGGFRGIISETLWIRADRLQQQGRYMELVQLSDWITALDPRATDGWTFNAWNLAYNIPAMLPDLKSRVPWVRAGISLLRDKALPANPASPRLHKELGWLYQNKIGSSSDEAHLLYKLDLAADFDENGQSSRPIGKAALDPDLVKRIEARFGKIDWRLANAHALYWACKGLELDPQGFEEESLRRMVQQTLVAMIFAGRFTGDVAAGRYQTEPAFELVPGLERFFEESIRLRKSERRIYLVFLARLVHGYRTADLPAEARDTYEKLVSIAREVGMTPPPFEAVAAGALPVQEPRKP